VLLVAAALMMKSFVLLQGVEPGYVPGGVLAVRVSLTADRFDERAARLATLARLRERLTELPGVVEAAAAPQPPTALGGTMVPLDVAGLDVPRTSGHGRTCARSSARTWARSGCRCSPAARRRSPSRSTPPRAVAVVSEGMARRVWPGESALGRTVALGGAVGGEPLVGRRRRRRRAAARARARAGQHALPAVRVAPHRAHDDLPAAHPR
jgi:hypothetical protein